MANSNKHIKQDKSEVNIKLTFKESGNVDNIKRNNQSNQDKTDKATKSADINPSTGKLSGKEKKIEETKPVTEKQVKQANKNLQKDKSVGKEKTPDQEQQTKRQLYRQQQLARLGQKLPEQVPKSTEKKDEKNRDNKTGNEFDTSKKNEQERKRRLETAKHLAKAAAHATAGSKTAAVKEGLKAVKSAGGAKALSGMIGQAGTAKILAWAWRIAFTGVGFIFTFFYVNFHGVMCYIVSSPVFCHFGTEWTFDSKLGKFSQKSKAANFFLEIAELIVVILVDIIVFVAFLIVVLLIYYMIRPDMALKDLGFKLL